MVSTHKLDDLIVTYERRLSALREMKSLLESDPELAMEVVQAVIPNLSMPAKTGRRTAIRAKQSGQYDRMVKLMQDGEWRTLDQIAEGIGAKKHSVAPYLYRDETKDHFESRKHPEKPRMVQWRLKRKPSSAENSNESEQ